MTESTGFAPDPNADLGARLLQGQQAAGAGIGSTDVDPAVLLQAIRDMQDRLDRMEAEKAASAGAPSLVLAAESLAAQLAGHSHAPLVSAVADLVEAARNAVKSGDVTYVKKIAADIARIMRRNAPPPGDNHTYRQALDFAENHVPDAADELPPPSRAALAGQPGPQQPTQVVAGHVTG